MPEKIYSFNGKDITMNICIQIRDVVKLLQEHFHIAFEEAVLLFYKSETYKTLQETENGLWAESAEYIADRYYEEKITLFLQKCKITTRKCKPKKGHYISFFAMIVLQTRRINPLLL